MRVRSGEEGAVRYGFVEDEESVKVLETKKECEGNGHERHSLLGLQSPALDSPDLLRRTQVLEKQQRKKNFFCE